MEALEIKRQAEAEGVRLILDGEKLKARGDSRTINKWLPEIRKHKQDLMTVISMTLRTWTAGNPYTCKCGDSTGWMTNGQPLCPDCVPPVDPEQYREDMLKWAAELEQAAKDTNVDRRTAMMAVVQAIKAEVQGA